MGNLIVGIGHGALVIPQLTGPVVDYDLSTFTAADSVIANDGSSSTTVTLQLKDQDGNDITASKGTVTWATDEGTLSGATNNADGSYTVTLTSSTDELTATVTAKLEGVDFTGYAQVGFGVYAVPDIVHMDDFTGATWTEDRHYLDGPVGNAYRFTNPWYQVHGGPAHDATYVDVIDDPTGGGFGKILRFHFCEATQQTGEIGLGMFSASITYGQTIWFGGYFYGHREAPDNTVTRKYLYFFSNNGALCVAMSSSTGTHYTGQQIYNPLATPVVNDDGYQGPNMSFDAWHCVEIGMGMNTEGDNNGWYKRYLDGALVHELNNAQIIGPGAGIAYNQFSIGYQVNDNGGDDTYYWAKPQFSTARIGP